jgi:hypothetical protein
VAATLRSGLDFTAGDIRFELRADETYALAYDDDLGAWASVDSISYGERYHLLVGRHCKDEVASFLRDEAVDGWQIERGASSSLPGGWDLISGVRLDMRPRTAVPAALAPLIPVARGPRLRVIGGLPIGAVPGVYLRGGEPAVSLSALSDDDSLVIELVGSSWREQFVVDPTATEEFDLSILGLEPGRYRIVHGESSVTIQIEDGIRERQGPGAGTVSHRGRDGVMVIGTTTSSSPIQAEPITVPAPSPGDASVVLGCSPEHHKVVQLPLWLEEPFGFLPTWRTIDAWVPFDAVWHLVPNRAGNYEALLLDDLAPEPARCAAGTPWARWILRSTLAPGQADAAERLWELYTRAASNSEAS